MDNLSYFRSQGISAQQNLSLATTVAHGIRLKTASGTFGYVPHADYSNAPDPHTPVGQVQVQLTGTSPGPPVAPSTDFQVLTPSGGLPVVAGNHNTDMLTYTLSPSALKAGFVQAGAYTANLAYEAFDAGAVPQAGPVGQASVLTVQVDDMSELKVNDPGIELAFGGTADYAQGVSAELPTHLTLSKTTPYEVYIKATSATLNDGQQHTIPVSVVQVGPAAGQAGVTAIQLSETPQKIIDGAAPVVDRTVGIRYSISPEAAQGLLGKPAGNYTTTVIYSFTAL
ncbi:hypothetical protein [Compostibacter hankyongensis]|uniref:hypothetical protein n=1 Tax=Compostibacter hankyongensis TaxID=1007089 RepID=UPI0031EFCE94